MLTSMFEERRSVDRMNKQRTSYSREDKHSLVATTDWYYHLYSSEEKLHPYAYSQC